MEVWYIYDQRARIGESLRKAGVAEPGAKEIDAVIALARVKVGVDDVIKQTKRGNPSPRGWAEMDDRSDTLLDGELAPDQVDFRHA